MATSGEARDRLWGGSHGRRHETRGARQAGRREVARTPACEDGTDFHTHRTRPISPKFNKPSGRRVRRTELETVRIRNPPTAADQRDGAATMVPRERETLHTYRTRGNGPLLDKPSDNLVDSAHQPLDRSGPRTSATPGLQSTAGALGQFGLSSLRTRGRRSHDHPSRPGTPIARVITIRWFRSWLYEVPP